MSMMPHLRRPTSPRPPSAAASKGQDEKLPGARERESNVSFFAACLQSEASERERGAERGAAAKLIGAKKPSPLAYPRTPLSAADKLRPIAVSKLEREVMGNGGWLLSFTNHMLVTRQ